MTATNGSNGNGSGIGRMVARFIARPKEDGSCGIIIGACSKDSCSLKSNTVYEIKEIDGEMVIDEIGESWITMEYNHETGEPGWTADIGNLMRCFGGKLLLSRDEADNFSLKTG